MTSSGTALWTCCRTIVQDSEKRIALELEEKEQELAERIANATLDSLKLKIDVDLAALRKAAPSPENDAIQAALDCKWLKDRQLSLGF